MLVLSNKSLDYFGNLRRARMTTAQKAMEGDFQLALQRGDYAEMDALYQGGADVIAGSLHPEGML